MSRLSSLPLQRNLLFIFLFPPFFFSAESTRADDPPKVTLERIVDGRGNRVLDVAKAVLKHDNESTDAWIVRGLVRSDVVLRRVARKDANSGEVVVSEIRLDGHAPLRLEGGAPGSRVSASSPASTFRYFEADAGRKTVRCNLSRLVDETDRDLLNAAAEYALLKQALGESYGAEELPILTLLTVEKRPPHPSPPTRKRVSLADETPEAEALRSAVLAALSEEDLPGQAADFARAPVDPFVLLGGSVPGEVARHAVPDDAVPDLPVKEDSLRPEDGRGERMR
jgi:hypothetical protein